MSSQKAPVSAAMDGTSGTSQLIRRATLLRLLPESCSRMRLKLMTFGSRRAVGRHSQSRRSFYLVAL
jgi:hypothetical protein